MTRLRERIAEHIQKHLWKRQRIAYNFRDVPQIETDQEVYLNLADSIIPMVKAELNSKKVNPKKAEINKEPEFTITQDELVKNGWLIIPNGFPYLATKPLGDLNNEEDNVRLVIHPFYNTQQFALVCPDGTLVNIGPYTIEELNLFERMILYVEPPY